MSIYLVSRQQELFGRDEFKPSLLKSLLQWSRNNELPGIKYYCDKAKRPNLGRRTTHIISQNIHRAIRNNHVYRGFRFKKAKPLAPEFGIVKWEINNLQDDNQ